MPSESNKPPSSGATSSGASTSSTGSTGSTGSNASRTGGSGMSWTGDTDFTKFFSDMKLPNMPDMEAFVSAHRKNMETLSAANRVALEGAQAVARRHMEIMQQTMGEMSETLRSLASTDAPQAKAAKQAELLKRGYERAVANMKELSDLIQRSNGEALSLLNKRFTEAMDEIKAIVEKAGQKSA